MLFKFPLPGPLKRKLLPGEGLDGDRLRAGLGSGLGFRAGVSGWGFGAGLDFGLAWVLRRDCGLGPAWVSGWLGSGLDSGSGLDFGSWFWAGLDFGLAWVLRGLQKRLRFGAELGLGSWSGFLVWVPGWARFSGVLRRDCGLGLVWFLREKVQFGANRNIYRQVW